MKPAAGRSAQQRQQQARTGRGMKPADIPPNQEETGPRMTEIDNLAAAAYADGTTPTDYAIKAAAVRPQETPTIPTATQIQHEAALRGYHTAPAAGLVVDEQAEEPTPVSGTIGVSSRFARAAGKPRYARAAGHPAGGDWVRLRTGGGRCYEGYRSPTCPGDGKPGHQHDIRCVEQTEG